MKARIDPVRQIRTGLAKGRVAVLYAAPRPRHSARAAVLFNLKDIASGECSALIEVVESGRMDGNEF